MRYKKKQKFYQLNEFYHFFKYSIKQDKFIKISLDSYIVSMLQKNLQFHLIHISFIPTNIPAKFPQQ